MQISWRKTLAVLSLFCREYVTTAVIDGRVEEIRDTACREPKGGWRRTG